MSGLLMYEWIISFLHSFVRSFGIVALVTPDAAAPPVGETSEWVSGWVAY
jgi:hypothetical protein